jgi:phage gp36-like protein
MPKLLTIADMKTHLYAGVRNVITQGDTSILQNAIDTAIAEAKGFCSRFNLVLLFDETDLPDPILQMHCKNMAKWHFITLANPSIDYTDAETRYDQAIKWLKEVQAARAVPPGWLLAQPEAERGTYFHVKSNPKRKNHY